jgi:hypothetical protein
VYVPEQHYFEVVNFVAGLMKEAPPPSSLINGWTAAEIGELRCMMLMPVHDAGTATFDLACSVAGKPVLFEDAVRHAGRTFEQGRADLARVTRLIRKKWGKDRRWPLNYKQEGTRFIYFASQEFADAWNAAEPR